MDLVMIFLNAAAIKKAYMLDSCLAYSSFQCAD